MPEKKRRVRQATNINQEEAEIIKALAEAEQRNFTQQVHVLLREAIAARNSKVSAKTVKGLLQKFSLSDLLEIVEEAVRIWKGGIKETTTSKSIKKKQVSKLVKENWESCLEVWNGVASIDRLSAIAEGAKPTLEELELLELALPVEWDELVAICQKEFENGNAGTGLNVSH